MKIFAFLILVACVSCGGGSSTSPGPAPTSDYDYGAMVVNNNSSKTYINSDGNLVDLPNDASEIVQNGQMGYSYGFGYFPANEYGYLIAEDGEQVYLGVAAVLSSSQVGTAVFSPNMIFDGHYQLQYQAIDASGDLGAMQNADGTIHILVNLGSGVGALSDDFMTGSSQPLAGSELLIGDGYIEGQDFELEVSYEGAIGYLEGIFGQGGLVGAMAGEGESGFFVGGVIADPN